MKKLLFWPFAFLLSATATSQNLNTGDVVVIGLASDTGSSTTAYSEFSWVPLVNLETGTKIYFTDAGYNTADANFMGTGLNDEILLRYIVPSGGIPAGTVLTLTEGNIPANYTVITGTKFGNDFNQMLSLPNAGDQITVFQSDDDDTVAATFGNTSFHALFMVSSSTLSFTALTANTASVTPTFNLDNVTNLAPGLTAAQNAVAVGSGPLEADEVDNARYTGITTGTRDEILFAVSQFVNWTRYDAAFGNDLDFGTTPNGWTANSVVSYAVGNLSVGGSETIPNLTIYPNPTHGKFEIATGVDQTINSIVIFNTAGQVIKRVEKNENSVDLSEVPDGCYFLKIQSGTSVSVKKVIKQ
ncbi:MAG: T9SS type A sorting domain-containing protein [Flavobacterium sp.]|nr:T9SS type A sorting domain-containing protein [Flavobacterium sp.]